MFNKLIPNMVLSLLLFAGSPAIADTITADNVARPIHLERSTVNPDCVYWVADKEAAAPTICYTDGQPLSQSDIDALKDAQAQHKRHGRILLGVCGCFVYGVGIMTIVPIFVPYITASLLLTAGNALIDMSVAK